MVHTSDYQGNSTTPICDKLSISAAQEVLTSLTNGHSPRDYILGVGYAGWGPTQLDHEIEQDAWWLADMDLMSIISHSHESRWDVVMNKLGLDPSTLSSCFKA